VDQETQQYYDNYFNLFNTEGWQQLMKDFNADALQINSVDATKNTKDLHFRKGQLNVLAHLLNLQSIVENSYEEATKTEEDD
jgi:hypothetical protein